MKSLVCSLTCVFMLVPTARGQNTSEGTGSGNAGNYNSAFGYFAGNAVTSEGNTLIGAYAGALVASGDGGNSVVGYAAGRNISTGANNSFLGLNAGYKVTTGGANIFIGPYTGYNTTTGGGNVFIGSAAGLNNVTGSGNVFIGGGAGSNDTGSNRLYIDNSNTSTPLVYGDFSTDRISINGVLAIGTMTMPTGYKLAIAGKAVAEEVVVKLQSMWPDYVFEERYHLPTYAELENYIRANRHLPGVPTAAEVREEGVTLGEMNVILLKKIEELTLYILEQDKRIQQLEKTAHK